MPPVVLLRPFGVARAAVLDPHLLDAHPARARHQDGEAGDVADANIRDGEPSDVLRQYAVVRREAAERHVRRRQPGRLLERRAVAVDGEAAQADVRAAA